MLSPSTPPPDNGCLTATQQFLLPHVWLDLKLSHNHIVKAMQDVFLFFFVFFVFLPFLGLLPWHTEVPRLGVESEL